MNTNTLPVYRTIPANNELLHLGKMGRKFQCMNVAERQQALHNAQDIIAAMRQQYRPDQLAFKTLTAAYESIRLSWFALGQEESNTECFLQLDGAVQEIAEQLFPVTPEIIDNGPPHCSYCGTRHYGYQDHHLA